MMNLQKSHPTLMLFDFLVLQLVNSFFFFFLQLILRRQSASQENISMTHINSKPG